MEPGNRALAQHQHRQGFKPSPQECVETKGGKMGGGVRREEDMKERVEKEENTPSRPVM